MKELTYNGHTIKIHDSIETMPITVFNRFNLLVAIDAQVGGTMEDADRHFQRIQQYIAHKQYDNAGKETEQLRQAVAFVIEHINPQFLSFAALVCKIDGKPVQVRSVEDARAVLEKLEKTNIVVGFIRTTLAAVKKKLTMRWRPTSRRRKTSS